ncbi:MAG: outer membrane beta-barrel protein, partial [Nitrospinae bacterium]|nr:outer membrane beta-barrel protein [Nitrospinota bacterium]
MKGTTMLKTRRFLINGLISISLMFGFASTTYAEPALELLKDIEVHGFVTSSYTYNFAQPSNRTNALRVYDFDDDSFKLDTAEIVFKRDAEKIGDVGFRLDMTYGFSHPQVNKSAGGPAVGGADVTDDDFDLQIGFVQYNAPVGNGLLIDIGKFGTHIGSEVMDGYDGYNYNFSRSFLFNLGPFTHTGI